MPYRWILFDWDGTLVNSIDALYHAYQSFLQEYGYQGTREEFARLNGPSLYEVVGILQKQYALTQHQQILFEKYHAYVEHAYMQHVSAMQDAESTLAKLLHKGYRVGLVTSATQSIVLPLLHRFNWQDFFSACFFADVDTKAKPDPALYLRARNACGHALAVEDSPAGVMSAHAAGMRVIGFAHQAFSTQLKDAGADDIITGLAQIIGIVDAQ